MAQNPDPAFDTLLCLLWFPPCAVDADERGDLVLKRTEDLGKTFTTIHEDIYSFGYIGAFLFFSVMEDPVSLEPLVDPPPSSAAGGGLL